MGTRAGPGFHGHPSYVIEGRGNAFSFCSCAHSDLLLDEAPAAYKDIRVVMRGQSDLVKTVFELTPLLSVKGR